MKTKFTLLIFLLILANWCKAQNSTALSTVLIQTGYTVNEPFATLTNFMVYNGSVETLSQNYNSGAYTNNAKSITGRDNKSNLTRFFNYFINSGNWEIQDSDIYVITYDANQRISSLWQSGKGFNPGSTKATMVYNVGYNAAGKPIYINYADTFSTGTPPAQVSVWVDSIDYNASGKMTRRSSYKIGTGGTYMVPANFTNYYEYSGANLIRVVNALTANGDTAKMSKVEYDWDAQNKMTEFRIFVAVNYLSYKDSLYEQSRRSYLYDGTGKLDKINEQRYSGTLQPAYTYDAFVLQAGNKLRSVRRTDILNNFADSQVYFLNTAGNPDSVQIYFGISGGPQTYRGHILYSYTPSTPTGIAPIQNSSLIIYPNPAREALTIESECAIQQCNILNLQGALMLSAKGNSKQISINTNELPKGIYLVQILDERGNYTRKLVIE